MGIAHRAVASGSIALGGFGLFLLAAFAGTGPAKGFLVNAGEGRNAFEGCHWSAVDAGRFSELPADRHGGCVAGARRGVLLAVSLPGHACAPCRGGGATQASPATH